MLSRIAAYVLCFVLLYNLVKAVISHLAGMFAKSRSSGIRLMMLRTKSWSSVQFPFILPNSPINVPILVCVAVADWAFTNL